MKVLICKALIGPLTNHEKFISVSNMRRAYSEIKNKSKIPKMHWNTLHKKNGEVLCQI